MSNRPTNNPPLGIVAGEGAGGVATGMVGVVKTFPSFSVPLSLRVDLCGGEGVVC